LLWNYDKLDKRDKETVLGLIETMLKKQNKEEIVYPGTQPASFEATDAEPAYIHALKDKPETGGMPAFENNIEFLDREMIMIPYFGKTAAGNPLDIYTEPGEYMPFPRRALKGSPEDHFILSVQGYSMTEADIDEGDMVVIRHPRDPADGKIMLVRYEGAATLKRLACRDGKWHLLWDDGSGREIPVDKGGFEVQGLHIWTLKPGR
jgi:SOS-response transcriptional repressor LexA